MTLHARLSAIVAPLPDGSAVSLPVDVLRAWLADDNGTAAPVEPAHADSDDVLISVPEAAGRLGVDPRWIYRRGLRGLPWLRQISPRTLRASSRELDRWISRRAGAR
jgi:predicted DNA-binding transcriptional regulator AlpA